MKKQSFLVLLATGFSILTLAACSARGSDGTSSPGTTEEAISPHVSALWVERQLWVTTLDRMFLENGPDEVSANIDDESREILEETRIIRQEDGEYSVELNKDEWRTDAAPGPGTNQLDQALANAMYLNEVTWCRDSMNGEDFVDAYTDEFQDAFDTHEEYGQSIADYVDCGTGEL